MMQRPVGSGQQRTTREYLVIEYAPSKRGQPGDRLYAPTDQLDQVTRYVRGEPALRAAPQAGPGHPQRRGRAAVTGPDGWLGLGQAQGPGPQGGPPDRRGAD